MFAAVHPAELVNQRRHFPGHRTQRLDSAWLTEVHERPDMQASGRRVSIEACAQIVAVEDSGKLARVLAEPARIDSRVLDERNRTLVALSGGAKQSESGAPHFAKSPELRWRRRACYRVRVTGPAPAPLAHPRVLRRRGRGLAIELGEAERQGSGA